MLKLGGHCTLKCTGLNCVKVHCATPLKNCATMWQSQLHHIALESTTVVHCSVLHCNSTKFTAQVCTTFTPQWCTALCCTPLIRLKQKAHRSKQARRPKAHPTFRLACSQAFDTCEKQCKILSSTSVQKVSSETSANLNPQMKMKPPWC